MARTALLLLALSLSSCGGKTSDQRSANSGPGPNGNGGDSSTTDDSEPAAQGSDDTESGELPVADDAMAGSPGVSEPDEIDIDVNHVIPSVVLLDNGEDGDNVALNNDLGLVGYWYTYDDKLDCVNLVKTGLTTPLPVPEGGPSFTMTSFADASAPVAPIEGAQTSNQYAARFFGGGHASPSDGGFGAGLGIGLNASAGVEAFDLTAAGFVGFRFLARSSSGPQALHIKLKDAWSEPAAGKCIPRDEATCMPAQGCHDDPEVVAMLTEQWQLFEFDFDEFVRLGWSTGYVEPPPRAALDPSAAYQVQFVVAPVEVFDIWIDNAGFILGE